MVKALCPDAFDSFAGSYDADFTHSGPGRRLRELVWQRLAPLLRPGAHVLDLGCGTGEDAIFLARSGCFVTAADSSPAMLEQTVGKARTHGLSNRIDALHLDLNAPPDMDGSYDLVLSNFGALNCAADLDAIGRLLRQVVAPGGFVAVNVMGRFCAWETLWYGLRASRVTVRRWKGRASAVVGNHRIPVRYWRVGDIAAALGPSFGVVAVHGVGIALPPSGLFAIFRQRPALFRRLARLEEHLSASPILARLADHQLIILRREFP